MMGFMTEGELRASLRAKGNKALNRTFVRPKLMVQGSGQGLGL